MKKLGLRVISEKEKVMATARVTGLGYSLHADFPDPNDLGRYWVMIEVIVTGAKESMEETATAFETLARDLRAQLEKVKP